MFFVVVILLSLLILSQVLSKFRGGSYLLAFITAFIVIFVFSFIEYTPDRMYYIWWISDPELSKNKEPIFKMVTAYMRKNNLDYLFLHKLFVTTYSIVLVLLIKKFNKNSFVTILCYLPLIFIFYGTQIRFFLGYYICVLAFYHFYVEEKRILGVVLFILSVLCHYSLLLFLVYPIFYRINSSKILNRLYKTSIITFFAYTLPATIFINLFSGVRFVGYLKEEMLSSYAGGIFIFGPLIPVYFLIRYYYLLRVRMTPDLINDKKFEFLYKFSVIPLFFIGFAFTIQVVGHRMIMVSVLMPILMFFYRLDEIKNIGMKIRMYAVFIIVILLIFFHFNYSSAVFLNEWGGIEESVDMLKSNDLINSFIL